MSATIVSQPRPGERDNLGRVWRERYFFPWEVVAWTDKETGERRARLKTPEELAAYHLKKHNTKVGGKASAIAAWAKKLKIDESDSSQRILRDLIVETADNIAKMHES